jgi:hypothetical protein
MEHICLLFQRYNVQCSNGMIMIFQIRPHQRRKLFLPWTWTGSGCISIHTKTRYIRCIGGVTGTSCCHNIHQLKHLKRCRSYHIVDNNTCSTTSLYGSRIQQQTQQIRSFSIKTNASEDEMKKHPNRSLLFSYPKNDVKTTTTSHAPTTLKRTATTKAALNGIRHNTDRQRIESNDKSHNTLLALSTVTIHDKNLHNYNTTLMHGSKAPLFTDEDVSKMTPIQILAKYYRTVFTLAPRKMKLNQQFKNSFKAVRIPEKDDQGNVTERKLRAWHSIFTCPMNQKQYHCGKFMSFADCVFVNDTIPGRNGQTEQKKDYYYYRRRREAEHAAAARRLDEIQILKFRFCLNDDEDDNNKTKNESIGTAGHQISDHDEIFLDDEDSDDNLDEIDNLVQQQQQHQQATNKGTTTTSMDEFETEQKLVLPEEYYLKEHNLVIMSDNYTSETIASSWFKCRHKEKKELVDAWTSIFTCPISGIQYPSGTVRSLLRKDDPLLLGYLQKEYYGKNRHLEGQASKDNYISDELLVMPSLPQLDERGKVYYRTRQAAQDAASKYALDRIRFQLYNTQAPRFCREDPSIPLRHNAINNHDQNEKNSSINYKSNINNTTGINGHGNSHFERFVINNKTNHRVMAKKVSMAELLDTQGNDQNKVNNNNINNKIVSLEANRNTELATTTKQIRENDPNNESNITISSTKINEQTIGPPIESHTISETNIMIDIDAGMTEPIDNIYSSTTMKLDQDIHNLLTGMMEDDENEIDTVLTFVQSTFGKAPAQRLLETAVTAVDQPLRRMATDNEQQQHTTLKSIVVKQADSVVVTAEAWLESNTDVATKTQVNDNKNPHRLTLPRKQSNQKLILAKTILSALAEASQATPIGVTSPIEPVAKKVLDTLWKSDSNCLPDADTYSYFLKCIDGTNPIVAVEKAEAIVEAMMNESKHKTNPDYTLPKPNQSTYNALIQITAQVGGTSGRYPRFTDTNFMPDRQSFLSILSSCLYSPNMETEVGGFDREFVQECIYRMTELANELNNDQLLPDTYVYNAPLRWSGGPILWTQSRPYTRIIPWDNYEQIYAKGLKEDIDEDNNIRVKQSRDMESWLEYMENEGVSNKRVAPNVETYEAVIQGWLRTGTREGLDRAQIVLRKLIKVSDGNGSLKPRIQTFHPILASLYHSKIGDSWDKIYEWIEVLEKLLSDSDEVVLDSRLIGMKLTTLLQKQKATFSDHHKKSDRTLEDLYTQMMSNATLCSKLVHDASSHVERKAMRGALDDNPLDVTLFIQATKAWEYVATFGDECKDPKMTYRALSEMISLLVRFEKIIKATKPVRGLTFRVTAPLNAQLEHFVEYAQPFFTLIIVQLSLHHNIEDRPEVILLVEKMTRAIGEFEEIQARAINADDSKGNKVDYSNRLVSIVKQVLPDDHFNYQIAKEYRTSTSRHSFLWEVVKFLELVSKDKDNINDVVRLCHLVKNIASARRRSTRLVEDVDKILFRVHNNFLRGAQSGDNDTTVARKKSSELDGKMKKNKLASSRSLFRSTTRQRKSSSKSRKKINGTI